MKKALIIINGFYPYSKSEDYLSNEIKYIKGFDKIICFPTLEYGYKTINDIIDYPNPPQFIEINNSKKSYKKRLFYCIAYSFTHPYIIKEIINNIFKKQAFHRLKKSLRFSFQAINSYKDLRTIILNIQKEEKKEVAIYLYSYWMANTALTAILLKKDSQLTSIKKIITRCHRFDVYEYATFPNYIPYREFILSKLDKIFAISSDAKTYLENKYPKYVYNKIAVSRLGTFDYGINIANKNQVLKVVSCSWLRTIKRVDLIFKALDSLDVPIKWIHYGDGEEMSNIINLIANKRNQYLSVDFPGKKTNKEILESYKKEHFDIFINVSKNEGVPVSIMEAMSFGKIIIATNVGGTAEIVKDGENGFLLPVDFSINLLSEKILKVYNMDDISYKQMCFASRKYWELLSNAEQNYKNFYNQLSKL